MSAWQCFAGIYLVYFFIETEEMCHTLCYLSLIFLAAFALIPICTIITAFINFGTYSRSNFTGVLWFYPLLSLFFFLKFTLID